MFIKYEDGKFLNAVHLQRVYVKDVTLNDEIVAWNVRVLLAGTLITVATRNTEKEAISVVNSIYSRLAAGSSIDISKSGAAESPKDESAETD